LGAVDHFDQSATFESADRRMKETGTDGSVAFDHGGNPRRITARSDCGAAEMRGDTAELFRSLSNESERPMLDQTIDFALQGGTLRSIERYSCGVFRRPSVRPVERVRGEIGGQERNRSKP
jgi:hypothetical protein